MNEFEIFILAIALSLDALLVSFSYGLIISERKVYHSLLLACFFGFFQFFMPIVGCCLTGLLYSQLEIYSKWIVFVIFSILGLKFLTSAFEKKEKNKIVCISISCVFLLAIATSIDALGAGVSFKLLNVKAFLPSCLIGVITFFLSFVGFWVATIFKKLPTKPIEITGALLLIYLAINAIL